MECLKTASAVITVPRVEPRYGAVAPDSSQITLSAS